MKYLRIALVSLVCVVLLAVPAFAAEYTVAHDDDYLLVNDPLGGFLDWDLSFDGSMILASPDYYLNDSVVTDFVEAWSATSIFCNGVELPVTVNSSPCSVSFPYASGGKYTFVFEDLSYLLYASLFCSHVFEAYSGGFSGEEVSAVFIKNGSHYLECRECGFLNLFYLEDTHLHTDDCELCPMFRDAFQLEPVDLSSTTGMLYTTTSVLSSALSWVSIIASAVIASPVLLFAALLMLLPVAVYLFRRMLRR